MRLVRHVLVSSRETGDAFCVLRLIAPAGNVTLPHTYRATDEVFVVESGEVEVNRGGELLRGKSGEVIYLPKGIFHATRVIGNDDLRAVLSCVPGGFDRFFASCAEQFKKARSDMGVIVDLAAQYGIRFKNEPPGTLAKLSEVLS
jgi:mannose-6-phosphate isomerase-like protein (cupin superfamily)